MSTKKHLTDIAVRNLRPRATAREVPDGLNALYCVVQPSGHKSWAVRFSMKGKPVKLTLGSYPDVSLADARIAAIEARKKVKAGIDPRAAKQAAKIAAAVAEEDTVANVCERCIKFKGDELRTADKQRAILERLVYQTDLGKKPIREVKRDDIFALLDKIKAKGHGRMADVVLMLLRRTFNWYALRKSDFNSPIIRSMGREYYKPAEHRGNRTLNDDEIRAVWQASDDGAPFSALVRFLLLTTARKAEAAGMTRSEVDADGIWVLPKERSKSKHEVTRPLSKAAQAILAERPHIDGCAFCFTSNGRSAFTSFSDAKARLDAVSGVVGWRLHDLRRTARSLLSRAGVLPDIAERCLGHSLPPLRATYDLHKPIEEMRHGFESLASLIERIVHPPEGAVIQMPMRKRRR